MIGIPYVTAESFGLNLRPQSAGTDKPRPVPDETFSLAYLDKGTLLDPSHPLRSFLMVALRASRTGILATTFLEAEEYGWGDSQEAALKDLGSSLVGYLESLEARSGKLADSALADRKKLRALIDTK